MANDPKETLVRMIRNNPTERSTAKKFTPAQAKIVLDAMLKELAKYIFTIEEIPVENISAQELIELAEKQRRSIYDFFYPVKGYMNFKDLTLMEFNNFMLVYPDVLINFLKQM